MRNDRVQHHKLIAYELHQDVRIYLFALLSDQVELLDGLETKEPELEDLLELHVVVVLSDYLYGVVQSVF